MTTRLVRSAFPDFSMEACVSVEPGKEFVRLDSGIIAGKWAVIFFWPLDFTFVCPTEIVEFNERAEAFASRNAVLLGASADSHFVHLAWRNQHPGLKALQFPMLADYKKELARELGILEPEADVPMRATYIVDPEGMIRWMSIYDLNVGRNVDEVLRTLDALQTNELTPCNWQPGSPVLTVS